MSLKFFNAQTALDIEDARLNSKIDVVSVRGFLHGGEDEWRVHNSVVKVLSEDPIFDKSQRHFMTRKEVYRKALAMQQRVEELRKTNRWSPKEVSIALSACDEPMPINLHAMAFEPVVMSQGSPELISRYGQLIANRGILGCYLQTELGHGTNVMQLETTATYIPATEEFELHSPTLSSTKWWIGCLGKTATHGVVQARLILPNGEDVGPHLFFVQLRSLHDHTVLPRIKIGDIGPKALSGYPGVDNGFAQFDHVRIPRSQMLSKFAQVTKEGQYIRPPHAKLSYGGMLYIRSGMVTNAGHSLAKAATISIRYATVRRQGNKEPDGLERQIINYPSVHHRLLPILSRAYIYILLGRNLTNMFIRFSAQLAKGDTSLLAEMHATTSGLKVLVTTTAVEDIEVARRSLGGHGYSAFAGLGRLYASNLPSATYEGDNFVLDQQVVRAALKSFQNVITSKSNTVPLSPFSAFMNHLRANKPPSTFYNAAAWTDHRSIIEVLEWRAAKAVEARARAQAAGKVDASADQRLSRAITEAFVAARVGEMIQSLPLEGESKSPVSFLMKLYLLTVAESALVDLLSFGMLSPSLISGAVDPTSSLRMAIAQLCVQLLPEVIGLTDAFGLTDWELDSALGVFNGKVYEALWERAQTEPLNQTEVPDGYEDFIKPLLERGRVLTKQEAKHKL